MKRSPAEKRLVDEISQLEIIDAHEHLPPEHVRVEQKVDVFTLFAHYTRTDFISAGLSPEGYEKLVDSEQPLEERWPLFEQYIDDVRFGSYARPAYIALKEFYGYDDITKDNYREISDKMQAENTPGIYHRILRDKCNIKYALTQAGRTDYDDGILIPLMPIGMHTAIKAIKENVLRDGGNVKNLDDYLGVVNRTLDRWKSEGTVGLKMMAQPMYKPDREEAEKLFDRIMAGDDDEQTVPEDNPLTSYLIHEQIKMAAEKELTVAVHAGMWGDFRTLAPTHIIPIVMAYPETRFDLYHMGMPYVREAGVMGKNFPNVWLNLCWCHIISPEMTCNALDEYLDLVPMNKIIAFGGDYERPVEKVYGHLVMARENIARVLGGRVDRGLMSIGEAVVIAKKWFVDNPTHLYRLERISQKT